MSKTKKTITYLAFISMLWVLATCSSDDSSGSSDKHSSPSTAMVSLGCTGLQKDVEKGGTIEVPDLECNNGRTATDEIWNGLPDGNWKVDPSTNATSYVISVSATCGSVELVDVPCGKVNVKAASSSSVGGGSSSSRAGGSSSSAGGSSSSVTLTCTGLQASVAKGGTIAQPTLTCSNGETATDESWTGLGSGGWTVNPNTNSTSYPISVSATCGSVRQTGVSCGTVNVIAASSSSGGSSSSKGSSSSGNTGSSSSTTGGTSSSTTGGSSSSTTGGSSSSGNTGSSSSGSRYITCAFAKSSYTVGEPVSTPEIKCFEPNGTPYTSTAPAIGNATFTVASSGVGVVTPASLTEWKTNGTTTFGSTGISVIAVSKVKCTNDPSNTVPNANLGATCTPSLTITAPAPELTCDMSTIKAIAGEPITKPTVKCGTDVVSDYTLSPSTIWTAGTGADTYTVTATATCGGGSKTVPCGILTVHPKLTCGSVIASITVGAVPPKPTLTCGTGATAPTGTITWLPASMNTGFTTPGTFTGVKATATCGISQEATCSGTITVTPATEPE